MVERLKRAIAPFSCQRSGVIEIGNGMGTIVAAVSWPHLYRSLGQVNGYDYLADSVCGGFDPVSSCWLRESTANR